MTVQLLLVQAGLALLVNGVSVPLVAWLIRGRLRAFEDAQHATTAKLDSISTGGAVAELAARVEALANGRSSEAARAARADLRLRRLESFAVQLTEAMHQGSELPSYEQTPIDATGAIGL